YADMIFHTTDSGKSWVKQLDTVNYKQTKYVYSYKIKFYDSMNGITVGYGSDVYFTTDGGSHWLEQVKGPNDSLITVAAFTDVCFVNKDLLYATDAWGWVYKYDRNNVNGLGESLINNKKLKLKIYPNPFSKSIYIEFTNKFDSDVNLELYDILGNNIYSQRLGFLESGKHTIYFEPDIELNTGCYLITIWCGNDFQFLKVLKGE
ncbi:MAG: T9SS type A sorting domain-containing protein, partial [Bacteroidetes bacterium]|nr:T9SS type A sorting domain-containing protein [Bacteroidota bacterium]